MKNEGDTNFVLPSSQRWAHPVSRPIMGFVLAFGNTNMAYHSFLILLRSSNNSIKGTISRTSLTSIRLSQLSPSNNRYHTLEVYPGRAGFENRDHRLVVWRFSEIHGTKMNRFIYQPTSSPGSNQFRLTWVGKHLPYFCLPLRVSASHLSFTDIASLAIYSSIVSFLSYPLRRWFEIALLPSHN